MTSLSVNRRWLVVALAALAVVALVAAALLTADEPDSPGASPTGETTLTVAESSGEESSPTAPGSSPVVTGNDAKGSTPTSQPAVAPTKPVDEGAQLATVTTPPTHTLAMIERDRATANSTYSVVFKVYGFGPYGGATSSLVVLVSTSQPAPGMAEPYDFSGRNVLCRLGAEEAKEVTLGGTYKGVITLKPSGDVLVPWLSDVGKGN